MAIYLPTKNTQVAAAWVQSPCKVLFEMARRAPGENIDMEFGGKLFHIVQGADAMRHILRDHVSNYPKYFGNYRGFFGESRITTNGEVWRKLRDRSQPFITAADAESVTLAARRYFDVAVDLLLKQSAKGGGTVNVDTEVDFAAARTVGYTVLGFPFEIWGKDGLEDMRIVLRFATLTNFLAQPMSPVELEQHHIAAADAMRRLGGRFRAAVEEAGPEAKGLIALIRNSDCTNVDVFGEMATHLFAGFDTTAAAVSWALYLLALKPDLQITLRAVALALPQDGEALVSALADCTPLRAFVHEALRIFPPVPLLSRIAAKDDEIDGWKLSKGNTLLLSIIGLQHNSKVYADPARVMLSRHPNGRTPRIFAPHFLPFGDGQRVCPGARFAYTELVTALAVFLRRTQILPGGATQLNFRWDASLRRANGNHLRLEAL